MYQGKRILAVIPARGGSKGIPKKNLKIVQGKKLIEYTLDAVIASKYVDHIFVSTDDREIAEVAASNGINVPELRPAHLATDKSKTIDTIIHTLEYLDTNKNEQFDYVILLQPTQPLRTDRHIDESIELIIDKNWDSLIGVSPVKDHPSLIRSISNEIVEPLIQQTSTIRRQDFKAYFKVNGAIYINKIDDDFNLNTSLNDNKYAYIMSDYEDIDIDEVKDLELFDFTLTNSKKN